MPPPLPSVAHPPYGSASPGTATKHSLPCLYVSPLYQQSLARSWVAGGEPLLSLSVARCHSFAFPRGPASLAFVPGGCHRSHSPYTPPWVAGGLSPWGYSAGALAVGQRPHRLRRRAAPHRADIVTPRHAPPQATEGIPHSQATTTGQRSIPLRQTPRPSAPPLMQRPPLRDAH